MITMENIEKVYQTEKIETIALQSINLKIREGEFVSIMGPSGSGKSTLLNIMGLLDEPTDGRLIIGGSMIDLFDDRKLARMRNERIGFIFQTYHLIHDLSVVDNVEIPLLYRRMPGAERRKRRPEGAGAGGPELARPPLSLPALGRPAAAGRDRAGDRGEPGDHPRRRADRQPRQPDGKGDHQHPPRPQ